MRATVKVVGMVAGGREEVIAEASVNDPVLLVPEPDNPHDPNAVAVYTAPAGRFEQPVVSSVADRRDHTGMIGPADRTMLLNRQAGYLPAKVAAKLRLPAAGVVGWISALRFAPADYSPYGAPVEDVAGFDVTAWLPRRTTTRIVVPESDYT